MTVHRSLTSLVHACLLLTALLDTAAALPGCTSLYGTPDHESCDELLHGSDSFSGYTGIGNTDDKDHLFALPATRRPLHTTDMQWENKVNLPIIRSNLLCKLALIPILLPTGAISTDTSHYSPIARAGDRIQTACVEPAHGHNSGGHIPTGTNADLLLILYARNSDFDHKVRRKIALHEPVLGIESATGHIIPGLASGDGDDSGSSTGSPGRVLGDGLNLTDATTLVLEQR